MLPIDNNILLGIIVTLVILVLFLLNSQRCLVVKKINGTFTATPEFLEISKLNKFIMHINKSKSYLFITDNDDNVIFNDVITFNYNFYLPGEIVETKLYIPELEHEWKTDFYYLMRFDVVNNKLEIFDNKEDILYASMERQLDCLEEKIDEEKLD